MLRLWLISLSKNCVQLIAVNLPMENSRDTHHSATQSIVVNSINRGSGQADWMQSDIDPFLQDLGIKGLLHQPSS